jgi:hypothetical protein
MVIAFLSPAVAIAIKLWQTTAGFVLLLLGKVLRQVRPPTFHSTLRNLEFGD